MHEPKKTNHLPPVSALIETFGFSPLLASVILLLTAAICLVAVIWFVRSAPPRRLTLTSGPPGSSFQQFADSYQKILAAHGVELRILPSKGSLENFQRLQEPDSGVDIGFVQGGVTEGEDFDDLVSLGSVAHQPLWVFYRNPTPITRLSELSGKRLAVGAPGSGTQALAFTLLQSNGITGQRTTFLGLDATEAAAGLLEGTVDAVFLMGDSAPAQTLRTLIRSPNVQLYHFVQADAYVRRMAYLSKLELPEGSIDFGANLPPRNIALIGPTVELVARAGLNSALSDLLLDAAQEVHGKASLLQKRGEFPVPVEREIKISEDALRFYKSGKSFLYRTVTPFWLASLLNRILVAFVPVLLVLIPAIRFLPVAYRLRIQLRLYRCYRPLLVLERDAAGPLTREQGLELLRRLDDIEEMVNELKVPASFADQFYGLRGHIGFVRARLKTATPA